MIYKATKVTLGVGFSWRPEGGQEVNHEAAFVTSKTQTWLQDTYQPQEIISGHQLLHVQSPETQYKPIAKLKSQALTKDQQMTQGYVPGDCSWIVSGPTLDLEAREHSRD